MFVTTFAQKRGASFACSAVLCLCAADIGGAHLARAQDPPRATPISTIPAYAVPYSIGPGDTIAISYPYNAELNHAGPVGPDGRITLPFIGTLTVAGKTTDEVSAEISRDLYVDGIAEHAYPNVQITTYSYAHDIYVGGEVGRPGLITLSPGMDPLQAVITAGGFLNTARSGHVAIIHRGPDNRAQVINIDVHDYMRGKHGTQIVRLAPYDVVYVPKSKIAEVDEWVDNYINKTLPFGRGFNYNAGNNGTVVAGK